MHGVSLNNGLKLFLNYRGFEIRDVAFKSSTNFALAQHTGKQISKMTSLTSHCSLKLNAVTAYQFQTQRPEQVSHFCNFWPLGLKLIRHGDCGQRSRRINDAF